ncbi:MAG TPA: hypothetical protein VM680_10335 [Verrucomicrobiae bacterium]|nr:hypothetical protein [Verrucomicrobiae bacterium]
MAAKALLKIDVQIALLRRECDEGRANNVTIAQLKKLLEERKELIPQMLAERQIAFAC